LSPEQCEDLLRALKARFETYLDQCVNAYFNAEAAEIRKLTQRNSKDTAVERITSRWPHTLATLRLLIYVPGDNAFSKDRTLIKTLLCFSLLFNPRLNCL